MFVRYTIDDTNRTRPTNFPDFSESPGSRGQFITLAENHTLSPAVLNTFRFSYSRAFQNYALNFGGNSGDLSLGFLPGQQIGQLTAGSGVSQLGPSSGSPRILQQQIQTFSDDVFWSRGTHQLKFGALINRYDTFFLNNTRRRGAYTFSSLTQFLSGTPNNFSALVPGSIVQAEYRWSTFGFYLQDDWRVTPRFTLNLGLRYEFHNTIDEVSGHGAQLRDALHDAQATLAPPLFLNPSLRDFSPRLGFAWDVFGDSSTSVRGGFGLMYDLATFAWLAGSSLDGKPPFAVKSTVTTNVGFPFTVIPPSAAGKTIGTEDWHMQQPHMLQYSLTVERKLPGSMTLSLSYVGTRGLNLYQDKDGNPTVPQILANGQEFWTGNDPRINPNWSFNEYKTAGGDSSYNSLQASVQKRLRHNLQFQSSFTWSRVLDDTQGITSSDGGGSNTLGTDPNRPSMDWGPADFNIPLSWTTNVLFDLPSTTSRGAGRILNGWRVGGIFSLLAGQPFSPILSGNRSRSLVNAGSELDRPDLVPGRNPGNIVLGGPTKYFDPIAFVVQPVGFLGTSSRNILQGPGQVNMDFSLAKDFPLPKLGEGRRLEFRTEVFNLFNRPNFYIPITGAMVYTADATRSSTTPLSTAGTIDRTLGSARQLQFALRLMF
jgi:hypothetical protein